MSDALPEPVAEQPVGAPLPGAAVAQVAPAGPGGEAAVRGVSPDLAAPAVARHPGPDRMLIPEAVVLLIA